MSENEPKKIQQKETLLKENVEKGSKLKKWLNIYIENTIAGYESYKKMKLWKKLLFWGCFFVSVIIFAKIIDDPEDFEEFEARIQAHEGAWKDEHPELRIEK
ncbi:MAG: hypothetical protein AB7H48_03390 [Parachlamydiales bacterium]